LKYFYSAADVFVTTPWYEPFGITPLEAMACGTPVVGSSVGGIKFSVRDGETGYLVSPEDPAALASRLAHLYQQPKLLALFRRQAIRRVNDLFTWRHVGNAMAALYEEVIAASRPEEDAADAAYVASIDQSFDGLIETLHESRRVLRQSIAEAARLIERSLAAGGKLLLCGNGGSAADAQHLACELVGRFKADERAPLPALALTADSATVTALGNDMGYERVFAVQVEAFGRPGDVLIAISTSGRSPNVLAALRAARHRGMRCIGLLGRDGGEARNLVDAALVVPSYDTQHVQEVHTLLVHLLSELVEAHVIARQGGSVQADVLVERRQLPWHGELRDIETPQGDRAA
jgi:phosphoheptose isomerase